jgi:hypothetical protein
VVANTVSWRRVKALNARLGTDFVYAATRSHQDHDRWLCLRHDGFAEKIDMHTDERSVYTGRPTTMIRLLRTRRPEDDTEERILAELDRRAEEITGWPGYGRAVDSLAALIYSWESPGSPWGALSESAAGIYRQKARQAIREIQRTRGDDDE